MSLAQNLINSTGATRAQRARSLGVSTKSIDRYVKGAWPNPIRRWLNTEMGQKILLAILVDRTGIEKIRSWLHEFSTTETPAV